MSSIKHYDEHLIYLIIEFELAILYLCSNKYFEKMYADSKITVRSKIFILGLLCNEIHHVICLNYLQYQLPYIKVKQVLIILSKRSKCIESLSVFLNTLYRLYAFLSEKQNSETSINANALGHLWRGSLNINKEILTIYIHVRLKKRKLHFSFIITSAELLKGLTTNIQYPIVN